MLTLSDPLHRVPLSSSRPIGACTSISPAQLHSPRQPLTARLRHTNRTQTRQVVCFPLPAAVWYVLQGLFCFFVLVWASRISKEVQGRREGGRGRRRRRRRAATLIEV
ncbi:hypothetical protein CGRA01v4_01497 [Colletotrichum graminicola]|nr:hypothetical protein CGRA01v4_01497 [Colletotrichum graminicola]